MSNSGKNFQRTFNQYVRRNQGWVFIILTLVILFLSVFIFRSFSKTTSTPLENYQDQMTKMQEQINSSGEDSTPRRANKKITGKQKLE